ncbi:MAG TPA: GNAT family N-acetyltransferase [Aggregatilinea sp.]|uniref:GNAT family N-acetyltransferase n=1 Tax=Aggregatilinea sp. TaxID=2806333 RepID=UPI002B814AFF|nr:GNAT family N-acetyltransferase [Aggregatilinea sp.]HML20109.1 GNAT family N-acetyltransferase [Aggregatilinea sp.]
MKSNTVNQFIVRELRGNDELILCSKLDHTSDTDFVWQMDVRQEADETLVRFRTVRLPRTVRANYPKDPATLLEAWRQRDCFLVAAVDNVILGYVNMRVDAAHRGWIVDLVVGAPLRRRRIGSALLEQATRWAALHHLQTLTIETQTKNFPGISFALSKGFTFCGFNDHYYANQDIALFFSKRL